MKTTIRGETLSVEGVWSHQYGGIVDPEASALSVTEVPWVPDEPQPVARFLDGEEAYQVSMSEQLDGRRVRLVLHTDVCEHCGR